MSDELTIQTDTTLPDGSSVDGSTFADEGQSAPLVLQDNAATTPNESAEEKKARISQAEWKNMREEVKKSKERDAKILEALGVKPKEGEEVDAVTVLTKQIADLKSESLRKEFEAQVPIVRSEKYAEAWKNVVEAKQHLVQKGELSYEDLWKIIRDEGVYQSQKEAVQETQKEEKESFSGSVPFFGNSVSVAASDKLSPLDKQIASRMGWTEKNYQSAGVI